MMYSQKVEHQLRMCCVKVFILMNMTGHEREASCLHKSGYKQ